LGIVTGLLGVVVPTVVAVVVVVVAKMLPNRSMRAIIIISTAKAEVLITLADFTSCTNYWQMYLVALINFAVGTSTSSQSAGELRQTVLSQLGTWPELWELVLVPTAKLISATRYICQ
jgi:hypothetical protein